MNRSLLLLFFCLMSFSLKAQDYPMLHFTTEDGLPSNNVYSIYRDSKGFLWFATDKGIARYNGLKFETFTTFDGLPDNEIFLFKEDYEGRLWMATYNGALCYYKDGVFHTAANTPFLRLPFISPQIINITTANDSSVMLNFFNYKLLVEIKHEKVKILNFVSLKKMKGVEYHIYYKTKVSDNCYKLLYGYVVASVDSLYNVTRIDSLKYPGSIIYIQDQDQGYFRNQACSKNSYNNILTKSLTIEHPLTGHEYYDKTIHAYYKEGSDRFVATDKGLVINDTFCILNEDNTTSVTQDNFDNYWVSTINDGAYCLQKSFFTAHIIKYLYAGPIKYCKGENNTLYFVENNNSLYEYKKNRVNELFNYGKYNIGEHTLFNDEAYFIDDINKYYYYAQWDKLISYDYGKNKMHISNYQSKVDSIGIKELVCVGDNFYVRGLFNVVSLPADRVRNYGTISQDIIYNNNARQRIFAFTEAPDSSIWFSTLTNVYRIKNNVVNEQPQFQNIAFKFFIFFKQFIVGYTHDNQLLIVDYLKKKINIDTVLSQNCIWDKVYILDSTHILVTTNNAYRLLALNSNNKFSISTIENSFIPRQAEAIAIDSTNCYFFKKGSLTIIPKMTIIDVPPIPRLFFNVLKTTRNSYHISNDMEIPYDEARNLSVSFSRLVINGQQIIQQYSFSKNDSDNWKDIKGDEINLVNPNFGTYVVMVRARSLSTGYCEPIVFRLHILKPYWATWWFISIIGMLVVAIIVFMIRYRIAYLLRKNQRAHETEMKFIRSEYKALNALMNPHFIFNTLNNVQGLVNRNDKLAANEYLRVFADIIRQNMHNVSKETIPLQKEVELVVNYLLLEKLRFKELLNYSINIDERLDLSEIMVPPLLIQPLVENSIKHGILPLESVEGKVVINIYERGNVLYIEVRDNGIGMTKSQERSKNALHESFGMENIKKRMEQLSIIQNKIIKMDISEIKDRDGNLEWTMVSISMHLG